MSKYVYLIGWMDDSDGACGEKTGIKKQEDLEPLWKKGSEHVASYPLNATDLEVAQWEGMGRAFRDDFTATDTLSIIVEVEE
jgi:hypothetical protein